MDWDTGEFEYLVAAGWDESGPFAAAQRRDQWHVQVLGVEPAMGATRLLAEQRRRVGELVPGCPRAPPQASRRPTPTPPIPGGWELTARRSPRPASSSYEALAVDGETVLFTASQEPTQTHVWAHHPAAGLRRVSAEPGVHGGTTRAAPSS